MSRLWLLTADRARGKTCTLQLVLARLSKVADPIQPVGLLSPAVFSEGKKVAIDLLDLASGQRRRLAVPKDQAGLEGPTTRRWQFDRRVLDWGNNRLAQNPAARLLVIDEIGPLELDRGQGIGQALALLDAGEFELALVVVRPELLMKAMARWQPELIYNLDAFRQPELAADWIAHSIELHFRKDPKDEQ